MARPDRFARGSDHTSFNDHWYPAVAFREANENFAKQHSALDTVDGVDVAYLAQNARVNVVSLAALALAPPAPVVTNERGQATIGRQPSGYDAHLQWQPSPGATGYRVYWRDTWANDWSESRLVGDQTRSPYPASPSTITSSALRPSALTVTKASSARTSETAPDRANP